MFLSPHIGPTEFAFLVGIAGLVALASASLAVPILRGEDKQRQPVEQSGCRRGRRTRRQYGSGPLRAACFAFWIAFSLLLVFDVAISVSLYSRFVAPYATSWVLVGAYLLRSRAIRRRTIGVRGNSD